VADLGNPTRQAPTPAILYERGPPASSAVFYHRSVFPQSCFSSVSCFFLSCKANARVKPAKTGHGPHSSTLVVVLLYVLFVFFYVFLCSLYCLFCDVSCIVCVCMCTEQLPPGGYPIAVKYISYHIIYQIRPVWRDVRPC